MLFLHLTAPLNNQSPRASSDGFVIFLADSLPFYVQKNTICLLALERVVQ